MLFLILFVNAVGRYSFRQAELRALLEMEGVTDAPMVWTRDGDTEGKDSAFMEIELPSEDVARRVAQRSVCIKGIYHPWGRGKTQEECFEGVKAFGAANMEPYCREGSTFKINMYSYGGKIDTAASKVVIERAFDAVPFKGQVVLDKTKKGVKAQSADKRASHQFWYCEDTMKEAGEQTAVKGSCTGALRGVWFCREVSTGGREVLADFDLKQREYLCSTSMTAENSFLVANFAHASAGKLLLDPFCGSASLLVAAAKFGCYTMGGDIDLRVIRGKEKNKQMPSHCRYARTVDEVDITPFDNFRQYGLKEPLDIVRCDNARPTWRLGSLFDAIICDPPYGVRAGARKTGCNKETKPIPEELREGHIPGTIAYGISDVLSDLLDMSAKYLAVRGRLVFWLPTTPDYKVEDLPQHPCMEMLYNCEEVVTAKWQRRLITMKKTREPQEGERAVCAIKEEDEGIEAAHDNFAVKYFGKQGADRRDDSKESTRSKRKKRAAELAAEGRQGLGWQEGQMENFQEKDGQT